MVYFSLYPLIEASFIVCVNVRVFVCGLGGNYITTKRIMKSCELQFISLWNLCGRWKDKSHHESIARAHFVPQIDLFKLA